MGSTCFIGKWGVNGKKFIDVRRCWAAIKAIKKLGIKVNIKNKCKIYGSGLYGYKYKKILQLMLKIQGL